MTTGQEEKAVEHKGGAVAGRQGSSENNDDAKDGAPEAAACAPKAAAALPMPRHRRSKRSVSTRAALDFVSFTYGLQSFVRCLTLPPSLFVFQCIFRQECGGMQAWTVAWRRGAMLRPSTACHHHSLLVQGSSLLITQLFTAPRTTGGCVDFLLLTGFICEFSVRIRTRWTRGSLTRFLRRHAQFFTRGREIKGRTGRQTTACPWRMM
jgi:hypothetical protein